MTVENELLSHWRSAYLLALRITQNTHAAEDLVQEAYVRAFARLRNEKLDDARTWLLRITANLSKNWLRDRANRLRKETQMQSPAPAESTLNELRDALKAQLEMLEEKYRTPLSLHYEQGFTFREVAEILEVPEGTASSLITRGLQTLRERMAREGHAMGAAALAIELQQLNACSTAPSALLASIKAAAAKGAAAPAATMAGTIKLAFAASAALAIVIPMMVLIPSGKGKPGPAAETAEEVPEQRIVPLETISPELQQKLARKIDVDFRREQLWEVLDDLDRQGDVRFVFPGTIGIVEHFSYEAKQAAVKDVVEKLAAELGLDAAYAGKDTVVLSKRADNATFESLCTQLRSKNPLERCSAVFALGELADRRIYPVLFDALRDPDPNVIAWTVHALLPAHTESLGFAPQADAAAATIKTILDNPPEGLPRPVLIRLYGATRSHSTLETLHQALKDKDGEVREAALSGVAQIRHPASGELLRELLQDADFKTLEKYKECYGIVEALASIGDEPSVAAVTALLNHPEPYAQGCAVHALRNHRTREISDLLLQKLKENKCVNELHPVLLKFNDNQTLNALLDIVKRRDAGMARHIASLSLRRPLPKTVFEPLHEMLDGAEVNERTLWLSILRYTRDERLLKRVEAALNDPDFYMRHQAAEALAYYRQKDCVEKLAALREKWPAAEHTFIFEAILEARDPLSWPMLAKFDMRGLELEVLARTRDPKAASELARAIEMRPDIRRPVRSSVMDGQFTVLEVDAGYRAHDYGNLGMAMTLSGPHRNPALIQSLLPLLKSHDQATVLRAIDWLGYTPVEQKPIEALLSLVKSAEQKITAAALARLSRARHPQISEALIAAFPHLNAECRKHAVLVMRKQPGPLPMAFLRKLLNDADVNVRFYAAEQLARSSQAEGLDALIDLANAGAKTASSLVEPLVSSGDSRAIYAVKTWLGKVGGRERVQAADELLRLKSPLGLSTAVELCRDDDPYVRSLALSYLLRERPEQQHEAKRLLKDPVADVRYWAAKVLLKSDRDAQAVMLEQAKHADVNIRARAVGTLFEFPTDESLALLLEALQHKDQKIQKAARHAAERWVAETEFGKAKVQAALNAARQVGAQESAPGTERLETPAGDF